MPVAEMLKGIRQKALMSQESFSRSLMVSVATINRWENGKALPNITAMSRIKDFCEKNAIAFDELEKEWLTNMRRNKK